MLFDIQRYDTEKLSNPLPEGIAIIDGMLDEDIFQQAITRWKMLIADTLCIPRTLLMLPPSEEKQHETD